jgi:hypothetical protein
MEPMKPMKPMKPMEPMKPMKPMEPISSGAAWWPSELGDPSTQGTQNNMRYAFFPEKKRLLIEKDGHVTTYNSADHQISGVSQQHGGHQSLSFTSQHGPIDLGSLTKL